MEAMRTMAELNMSEDRRYNTLPPDFHSAFCCDSPLFCCRTALHEEMQMHDFVESEVSHPSDDRAVLSQVRVKSVFIVMIVSDCSQLRRPARCTYSRIEKGHTRTLGCTLMPCVSHISFYSWRY